jgi:hypothetical protein
MLSFRNPRMRNAEEFRTRQIDLLASALHRPGGFCGSGESADLYFSTILSDLCWIDDRESDFAPVCHDLLHGCRRVFGQFYFQQLSIPDHFANEIASTYAQAAYRLGYYKPMRVLIDSEFEELRNSIGQTFLSADHTESEIVSRFGQPTHEVVGGQTTVHCYGCCVRNADWVFFDYSRCNPPTEPHLYQWLEDPKLRNIRRTGENVMELLPFASCCRDGKIKDSK